MESADIALQPLPVDPLGLLPAALDAQLLDLLLARPHVGLKFFPLSLGSVTGVLLVAVLGSESDGWPAEQSKAEVPVVILLVDPPADTLIDLTLRVESDECAVADARVGMMKQRAQDTGAGRCVPCRGEGDFRVVRVQHLVASQTGRLDDLGQLTAGDLLRAGGNHLGLAGTQRITVDAGVVGRPHLAGLVVRYASSGTMSGAAAASLCNGAAHRRSPPNRSASSECLRERGCPGRCGRQAQRPGLLRGQLLGIGGVITGASGRGGVPVRSRPPSRVPSRSPERSSRPPSSPGSLSVPGASSPGSSSPGSSAGSSVRPSGSHSWTSWVNGAPSRLSPSP